MCASVSTLWHLAKEDAALYRPNAAILCYAMLTTRLMHCRDFLEGHADYAKKLCEHGVPFECHIFPKGGHGAPWCDDTIWAKPAGSRDYNYIRLSVEWMRELFGLL